MMMQANNQNGNLNGTLPIKLGPTHEQEHLRHVREAKVIAALVAFITFLVIVAFSIETRKAHAGSPPNDTSVLQPVWTPIQQSVAGPPTWTASQQSIVLYSQEAEVLRLTNNERTSRGLKPLVIDATLTSQAREHNWKMATHQIGFRHSGLGGENIIWNYGGPQASVTGWMNSPGHRANILNPSYKFIGVSIYDAGNGVYATQRFQ